MSRLWWVRHGPTHAKALAGWRDIPADLSDTAALARLDAALPAGALLISSDLIRARDTAAALARGRRLLPADPALRELHFGDWDGLHHAEVSARWPDLSRAFWEDPGAVAPPGGESWHQAEARISAAVARLTEAHPGAEIVLVAHMGAILTQYALAARLTPAEALAQRIDPLSITRLDRAQSRWQVGCVNHIP